MTIPATGRDLGFTGTRQGMSLAQKNTFTKLCFGWTVLHHGDCVGADYEAATIARHVGLEIWSHPAKELNGLRGYVTYHRVSTALPPLERNKVIVRSCELLVAAPLLPSESLRSGTWHTIRFAGGLARPTIIINPVGSLREFPKGYQSIFKKGDPS